MKSTLDIKDGKVKLNGMGPIAFGPLSAANYAIVCAWAGVPEAKGYIAGDVVLQSHETAAGFVRGDESFWMDPGEPSDVMLASIGKILSP